MRSKSTKNLYRKFNYCKAHVWIKMKLTKSPKFSLLLACRGFSGEAVLRKCFETTKADTSVFLKTQQK